MLTVATLNLLNDLSYWDERSPLIVETLRELSPAVLALQEVSLPHNNAAWLARQLEGYTLHLCPCSNQKGKREGLAILSRLPIVKHDILALGAQNRVAQRLILHHAGRTWALINTHLYWSPIDDPLRIRQVEKLLNWAPRQSHNVICGDFNAQPHYRAIKLIKHRFTSAFEAVHGSEPDFTFPTALKRGPGLRNSLRRSILRAGALTPTFRQAADARKSGWQGTVDYIFASQSVRVADCQLAFDRSAPGDDTIYPSDHRGLIAALE